jgi:hypothetical protein
MSSYSQSARRWHYRHGTLPLEYDAVVANPGSTALLKFKKEPIVPHNTLVDR